MRVTEINTPRIEAYKEARIESGTTKNKEGRMVYLDDELLTIFKRKSDCRTQNKKLLPYVFVNETGTDRIKDFRGSWKKACNETGTGKKLFHDLRRTALRNIVRANIPERVAMMVSGHKTRSVFERYNIVNDTDIKLALQKQETYLQAQNGHNLGTIIKIEKKELSING